VVLPKGTSEGAKVSEYQYYEFRTIDRQLTEREMRKLRSYSTRARITSTGFINDYSYGNFRGNEDEWMGKYFDAFLYLANWGTHVLKLRLPSQLLDVEIARLYCLGKGASLRERNGKIILSFVSDTEEGGEWVEGEGWLDSLIPARAELARGDLRCLYLAWLLGAQKGELADEDIEPAVPAGLGQLSPALDSFVEFLRIDTDLLYVAAQASQPMDLARPTHEELLRWVSGFPSGEKDELLARLIEAENAALPAELLQRFIRQRRLAIGNVLAEPERRMVGALRSAAEEFAAERRHLAAKKAAEDKARRERKAAIARAKHLEEIAGHEPELWCEVESLIATKQTASYDNAVELLVDLRDLAERSGKTDGFRMRVEALRATHTRRPALMERIRKAGLGT
jgi:hypothetical protein